MIRTRRRTIAASAAVLVGAFALVWAWVPPPPEPTVLTIGRHRGLDHWIGCHLEEWGVIPRDPFRHIEG
jgi:hypothetical protein